MWKRTSSGDEKRSHEERDRCFNEIINKKDWVVEGSPRESLKESFGCCDYIIVLDEYTLVRLIRVFKRWINQRRGKEAYNSEPTLEFLWWNIKWVFEFNKIRKGLIKELNSYGEKLRDSDILKKLMHLLFKNMVINFYNSYKNSRWLNQSS